MKRRTLLLLTAQVLLLTHENAFSDVNIQEGSFTLQRRDTLQFSRDSALALERGYSSRSTHQGIFGLGWCSALEWRYYASERLLQKCDSFELLAAKSTRQKDDRHLVLASKTETLIFDASTRLVGIEQNGRRYDIRRDLTGRATFIQNPQGLLATLTYSAALQRLAKVTVGGRGALSFAYDQNQLARASEEDYQYDASANLTLIRKKEDLTRVGYDELKDQVLLVADRECETRYTYVTRVSASHVRDQVQSTRLCQKQKRGVASQNPASEQISTTEFSYEKTEGGRIRLEKISTLPGFERLSTVETKE